MNKEMNICDKYWWIFQHTKLQGPEYGQVWIEIIPNMVDPVTLTIEDDTSRNTKLQFWVECGGTCMPDEDNTHANTFHDWNLDCGGDTWEGAVEALYALVKKHYGEYTND